MKKTKPLFLLLAALGAAGGATTHGAITGQWDFNGDLASTIGQALVFNDGETQQGSAFGTTTSFGIPGVNGAEAQVMRVGKTPAGFGGLLVPTGAAPNGGGFLVNQYTVVMDVLFPATSSDKRRGLMQIDFTGDTDFAVGANNGIGALGGPYSGTIQPNTWYRIAFAVDLAAGTPSVSSFINGVKVGTQNPGGLDTILGLYDSFYLFNDDNEETETIYINSLQIRDERISDGLMTALGSPTANGILTGPPPNPYIASLAPSPESARIISRSTVPPNPNITLDIEDGASQLVPGSIVMKLDGNTVTPQVTKSGSTTTISYTPAELLPPLTVHTVAVTFSDNATPPNNLGTTWQFGVGSYVSFPASSAGPVGAGSDPGFKVKTAQAPEGALVGNSLTRAIQQLNGTLRNEAGQLIANEAGPGTNSDGSHNVDVIDFEGTQNPFGNFEFTEQLFPGIPGSGGGINGFSTEVIGYLALPAGTHKLGVSVTVIRVDGNDDDGFALFAGDNPRDFFSPLIGTFANNVGGFSTRFNNNEFNVVAPVAGVYPIRLVHYQTGSPTSLEFYSVDPASGEKILVNDASNPNSIKAFRTTSATRPRAPYIAEASPRSGAAGVEANAPIRVLIDDQSSVLNNSSIQMTVNGVAVTPARTKTGNRTTLAFNPDPSRASTANDVVLTYSDNATPPNTFTTAWSFTTVAGGGEQFTVRGQWEFNSGNLAATVGAPLEYFDGPDGDSATKTQFGTAASFGIPNVGNGETRVMRVPGDLSNKIGYIMRHGIAPNGGGSRVNKYTVMMDVYLATTGPGAAALIQTDTLQNTSDGDLFWQGNNFGQGGGGYNGTGQFTAGAWHRVAWAVDLTTVPATITKYVDGIKQDDWRPSDTLDGRRALQEFAILFADGDQDERREMFVDSVQVREGKLPDALLASLGAPGSTPGLPINLQPTNVRGQWDFDRGNLAATAGAALEFFDGPDGDTATKTQFGAASSFGIAGIDGEDVNVMRVPGDLSNKIGYIMRHGIAPNGGGSKVNKYTMVMDVYIEAAGPGAAALIQTDTLQNTSDGDLFWQGNNFGQGGGGYNGTGQFTAGAWHRVAWAVDLTTVPATITKYVDGIKQDDWRPSDTLDGRRALQEFAILFADGDQDERRVMYVNSVQVRSDKLSDAELFLLGAPTAGGLPVSLPVSDVAGQWNFDRANLSASIGAALEFFDGVDGETSAKTQFGTASSFGIAGIDGTDVNVMRVPGDLSNKIGYIMRHRIAANGGGSKVNKYTVSMDVYVETTGAGAAALIQTDTLQNTSDGDLFWQGNNFGQGGGGYNGTGQFTAGAWHRVSWAVDLTTTPATIAKFVDGIKQDDWRPSDTLDGRRGLQEFAILFADGDQDERRVMYVSSVQVRSSNLSDAQMVLLGAPTASKLPVSVPATGVTGLWNFDRGNLAATVGSPLEYFDGANGDTQTKTQFGTTADFGIDPINGQSAAVMMVPGDLSNKIGYNMRHRVAPNGGGAKANIYTIVMDVFVAASGPGAAALIQTDTLQNTSDGDLFWQGNNFGQGGGGYNGTGQFTAGAWHRVSWAVDLTRSPAIITKFVDGIKQDDWRPSDTLDGRRGLQEFAILFADGDQDERRAMYVNSVQVRDYKMSDSELTALGGPNAAGVPLLLGGPVVVEPDPVLMVSRAGSSVTLSWPMEVSGFVLETSTTVNGPTWTPVAGVANNSVTVQAADPVRFYRLRK